MGRKLPDNKVISMEQWIEYTGYTRKPWDGTNSTHTVSQVNSNSVKKPLTKQELAEKRKEQNSMAMRINRISPKQQQ